MLKSISIAKFFSSLITPVCIYYVVVLIKFYRNEIRVFWVRHSKKQGPVILAGLLVGQWARAQTADGNNGISQANTMVRGYYDTAVQLMYAVAAIVAILGAVHVFSIWNKGSRDDVNKALAAWVGSCIFIVVVATVIKSFFGL